MKRWDVIIIGGGVIGLSLAWRLKGQVATVLIVEKQAPAREATHAAGGMIAHCDPHTPSQLAPLVTASSGLYADFVRQLEAESGESADLRNQGTIAYFTDAGFPLCEAASRLDDDELSCLEPLLTLRGRAYFLPEASVDPRALGFALTQAARHRGVDLVTGSPVLEVLVEDGRAVGVRTERAAYLAGAVVNCAGAWAAQIPPLGLPTRPVKGQMVCVAPQPGSLPGQPLIQHVVRTPEVYIIPRSDGRILLGASVEDVGFDKRTDPDTVQRLLHSAAQAVPQIAHMRMHDAWAGLRPGTPDDLPILGETSLPGYYAATGHYRDGILLAPITAHVMTEVLTGKQTTFDLTPFSPLRFG